MKKASFVLALGFAMAILSCTKDPIVTEPTVPNETEKPTNPGNGGDNGGTTDPVTPPTNGETGVDDGNPEVIANFNDPTAFLNSLNKYKLQTYAKVVTGKGKDGNNALEIKGKAPGNNYIFTVENQSVPTNAKTITFFVKGSADKSLSMNVYKNNGIDYDVFNLRTDKQIENKEVVNLTSDLTINKTANMQDGKADTGQNDYFDVNIQAHNWIKITLNLTNVDYNKSKQGSLFALKVGKNGNYDLLISNISFDDKEPDEPTEPTNPTEPSNPGEYTIPNDQKAYYSSIDFAKTSGIALRDALGDLVQKTHKRTLSYTGVWSALKQADLTPDGRNVYLLYGHKGQTSGRQAYTRSVNANGGGGTDWNREHTYAKSLGTPNLGTSGPGADAHHLRPSDTGWNSTRGNKKFAKGNGNSGSVSGGWYPGDEWRGDVARMMMYMYIRYENRCLPTGVTIGSKNKVDAKMVDLLLEWNAADPVSDLEIQRNEYLGNASNNYGQGNRNPFIDNPHLATAIWGGPEAQNRWK